MLTVHLEFGGSTAARTDACPPWHAMARLLPRPEGSEHANLGTALHAIMEKWLNHDERSVFDPREFIGQTVEGVTITWEHIRDKIEPAIAATNELFKQYDIVEYEAESAIVLHPYTDIGGTADFIGVSLDKRTTVVGDFKFGDGHMVYAENNAQAMHYGACAMKSPDWSDEFKSSTRVVLAIIQPSDRRNDILDTWETTPAALDTFAARYIERAALARDMIEDIEADPRALPAQEHFKGGAHCTFCPAQAICPVKTGLFEQAKRLDPSIKEQLGVALRVADELEKWIASVRVLAHAQMDRGDKIPGWKLVAKRATRQWADEEAVAEMVKRSRKLKAEECYAHKLLSPAQMEKLIASTGVDWSKFEAHIVSRSSGTTLAPESDPRPEAPAIKALIAMAERTA